MASASVTLLQRSARRYLARLRVERLRLGEAFRLYKWGTLLCEMPSDSNRY